MLKGSMYDVTIIGGGPAGSTCGYLLGKRGLKVLIIDKAKFPRDKLCGGLLTLKTLKIIEVLFQDTEQTLRKSKIINFESNSYEVFFRNRCLLKNSASHPFYFVDRKIYDAFFLEKAKKEGVEVLEGEAKTSINYYNNEIQTSSGKILRTRYIIGADGANSRVRRDLFAEPQSISSWQRNLATALEVFLERKKLPNNIEHPKIFLGYVNCGYGWIFPNKERIVVGLGGLNRKNGKKLITQFHNFCSSIGLSGIQSILAKKGHPVPYGNFLENPVYKKTLLVGDAAGFVDPILGEGIFYAHKTAQLAAMSIMVEIEKKKDLRTSYLELLNALVYPQLRSAMLLRQIVFHSFNKYSQYLLLQIMLKLFNEKMINVIHEEESYRWFR